MKIKNPGFKTGYNPITEYKSLEWNDPKNTKMDFGILLLESNQEYKMEQKLEKAVLLMKGSVNIEWIAEDKGINEQKSISRSSIWDDNPWCLHTPKEYVIKITAVDGDAELAVVMTPNDKNFNPKLYTPEECASEERGKGTMRETSTRIVRTIFDDINSPDANLVLGEVINFPGKWSSYPPHAHAMPEIYHYRFLPEQGFGFSMLGEDAVQIHNGDTVCIFDEAHSQTSAPGYAMYYIWPIRHLDGNRYGPSSKTPIFDPKHLWVTKKENEDGIYPPKN